MKKLVERNKFKRTERNSKISCNGWNKNNGARYVAFTHSFAKDAAAKQHL